MCKDEDIKQSLKPVVVVLRDWTTFQQSYTVVLHKLKEALASTKR